MQLFLKDYLTIVFFRAGASETLNMILQTHAFIIITNNLEFCFVKIPEVDIFTGGCRQIVPLKIGPADNGNAIDKVIVYFK